MRRPCALPSLMSLGKWMPPANTRRSAQIAVDVQEARAGDMAVQVQTVAGLRVTELPAAIDELVAHPRFLPEKGPARWSLSLAPFTLTE